MKLSLFFSRRGDNVLKSIGRKQFAETIFLFMGRLAVESEEEKLKNVCV